MTCPKCGLETLADQKFCRSCGARLQLITQQLTEPQAATAVARKSSSDKDSDGRANNFVLWGFIVMLVGAAIGVVGKKLLYEDVVTVVGVLISLVGMFLIVYPYLAPSRRKDDASSLPSQPEALTTPQATQYLPEGNSLEYPPSVTERTTDLLKQPAAKRRESETRRT